MATRTVNQPQAPARAEPAKGGFTLLSSRTLHVGRAEAASLAREHQMLPHSPTERDMDARRVTSLVQRIKDRVWLPCCWATVTYDGVKYRMNGQHSSQAMLDAADDLPEKVAVHIDHYDAHHPDGMGQLFRQFDARFSGRTKQDVAGAYQGLVKALEGVSRRKGKLGIEGIAWYRRAIEGLPVASGDDLYAELMTPGYHPFLRWLDKILSVKTPELERAPIVGAAYATFITSESGAQDFWGHVAKNDLPDDSDPRSVLSQELQRIREDRGAAPVTPADFYAKCVKAWNAFRNGDKIRTLNVNSKKGLPDLAA